MTPTERARELLRSGLTCWAVSKRLGLPYSRITSIKHRMRTGKTWRQRRAELRA